MSWRHFVSRVLAISFAFTSLAVALFVMTAGGDRGMDRGMDRQSDHRGLSN